MPLQPVGLDPFRASLHQAEHLVWVLLGKFCLHLGLLRNVNKMNQFLPIMDGFSANFAPMMGPFFLSSAQWMAILKCLTKLAQNYAATLFILICLSIAFH